MELAVWNARETNLSQARAENALECFWIVTHVIGNADEVKIQRYAMKRPYRAF